MKKYIFEERDSRLIRREFYTILCAFNRRNELERLVTWAERKRLSHPLKLYQSRLMDEGRRLFRYSINSPRLTRYASLLHRFNSLMNRPPRYPTKGLARIYRYGNA